MNLPKLQKLANLYRDGLLKHTIPWWQKRFIDRKHGGFLTYRDADGSLLSTDKSVWILGRVIWMWSRLYNEVEKRPEWLGVARHGMDFLLKHAFDKDGRMFFLLTREGKPLRKRRYLFSESFGVVALAEYARATGSEAHLDRARKLLRLMLKYHETPGLLEPKYVPETRRLKALAMPMVLLCTTQVLRQADPDPFYDEVIDRQIEEILRDFMKPSRKCVLETVLPDGSLLDNPEGRTVNPGHAIEAGWFILEEARHRNRPDLVRKACQILEWSLALGWDRRFGGILYFVDCDGKPPEAYQHDMKLLWPHNEAIYGCLLAYWMTGDAKWMRWHDRVREWTYARFPDRKNGEWFGYLHRDGTLSSTVKALHWTGPFHQPRMELCCWKLLERMTRTRAFWKTSRGRRGRESTGETQCD